MNQDGNGVSLGQNQEENIRMVQARNREEWRKKVASNKNSFALKEMGNDKGMLTHHAVKEIITLRKLDHPNIAGV